MDVDTTENSSLFRPAKRRRFQRRRNPTEDGDLHAEAASPDTSAGEDGSHPLDEPAFSEILRHRRANKNRRQGIEFSTTRPTTATNATMSPSLATKEPPVDGLKAISDRFIGHTGQVVDVDKHMFVLLSASTIYDWETLANDVRMAYIDSEMAKRRLGLTLYSSATGDNDMRTSQPGRNTDDVSQSDKRSAQRHPASLGKIHEIDLGADASLRNVERTENAIRRAQNGEPLADPDEKQPKPRKVRIGRDGTLMKPRPRKRRNSEDIKRDQLVEQVLRESRLEIYDDPGEVGLGDSNGGDGDTDEKIAEQFRQDFMDAMESRQRNRTSGQPKMPAGKPGEVGQKGPKLGGSRSARAAMRERELAEQQKVKK